MLAGRFMAVALMVSAMLVLAACTETPVPRGESGGAQVAEGNAPSETAKEEAAPAPTEAAPAEKEAQAEPPATEGGGSGSGGESGGESGGAATVSGNEVKIELKDFKIVPAELTVKAGEIKFTWQNTSTHAHNYRIVKWSNHSEIIYPGPKVGAKKKQVKTLKLEPGEYYVFCNLSDHEKRGMKGKLTVQ